MRALAAAIGNVFVPNRVISPRAMKIIIGTQLTLTLALWWSSPVPVLPRPDEVAAALRDLWVRQGLGRELIASFLLNIQALALTAVISLALSYLTVVPVFRPVAAAVSKGRFLGLIGLTFVFTLMVGGGRPLKLSLLVFGMTVFFVTSMAAVIVEIPKEKFDHARTLGMPEWRAVWEVAVLGTADKAMEVFRQNAAIGWMMLTMVEGISRSEGGLGAMLLNQNKHFRLAEIFAIQLLILLVGILQDLGIGALRRFFFPYADLHLERK
jgi:NitT/TauT family transport system permease protein